MHPTHDTLPPRRPTQPQRLPPNLLLLPLHLLQLPPLLLLPALLPFEIPRRPFALSTLVHELLAVFLEGGDGVEGEFVVRGDLLGGAGDDEGGDGFVGADEVFGESEGDNDEVGFEVVAIADDEGGGDD